MNDFSAKIVHYVHLERSAWSATHPRAAVIVLLGVEHVLAKGVEYPVLVGRLPPSEGLQHLHVLLDQQVVHGGQILQTLRSNIAWYLTWGGLVAHHR